MAEFRKQEKRKFIEIVERYKLSPLDLILEDLDDSYQFKYLDSGIYFKLVPAKESYEQFAYFYTTYTPHRQGVNFLAKYFYLTDVLANFSKWIKENVVPYIEETNAPDPWEMFLNEFSNEANNIKFNESEIKTIENGLDNFPNFLAQRKEISTDKLQIILDEIQGLKKELKTKTKRKWLKSLFLFIIEEVWDATKDRLIMNEVKAYFLDILPKSIETITPWVRSLLS